VQVVESPSFFGAFFDIQHLQRLRKTRFVGPRLLTSASIQIAAPSNGFLREAALPG
jgi:hypothetical protein